MLGPSGLRQDDDAADDRRLRGADRGADLPRRSGRRRAAAVQAGRQHRLPELRALPAHDDRGQRRVRARAEGRPEGSAQGPCGRDARARRPLRVREAQAEAALRRPAAAGRARACARQPPARAAARRAARRPRSEAPQEHADGAEADPERGRDHVRPRHARPGRGDDDGGHDRGHEQRADRAARARLPSSTSGPRRRSSPAFSAPRTSCPGRSRTRMRSGSRTEPSSRVGERPLRRGRRRRAAGEDHDRRRRRCERAPGNDRRDRLHRRGDAGRRSHGGGHRARVRAEHGCGRARSRARDQCRTELGSGVDVRRRSGRHAE